MNSIAITNDSPVIATVLSADELQSLAQRIKERDRLAATYAHAQWLENGRDLVKAKALMAHGDFGDWCGRELNYSTRTAQKLMSAAELCEPYLENESGSHLPKPTLIYALAAPSVSQEIRDAYVPRLIAGEDVAKELRGAIQKHRTAAMKAKEQKARLAAKSPEAQAAQVKREAAEARREACELEQRRIEQERQATARARTLAFIAARLGDDLPALIALAAEAGSGGVFGCYAERELQTLARALATTTEAGSDLIGGEAGAPIEHCKGVTPNEGGPIEPMPMATLKSTTADSVVPPPQADPIADEEPPTASNVTQPPISGKYGDVAPVVSAFPPPKRGPTHIVVRKPARSDQLSARSLSRPTPRPR